MTTAALRRKTAMLARTPPLLIAQKLLRRVPFRPIDVGKLCLLTYDGVPRVPPPLLRGPATVREATRSDLDALAGLCDRRDAFAARFAAGDRCVIAEVDGRAVGFEWFCDADVHHETGWGYDIDVPAGYVYAYDAFIDRAYRNTGVWLKFKAYLAGLMLRTGKRGVLTFVDYGNWASHRTHLRFGFRPFDTVLVVKLFGRSIGIPLHSCSNPAYAGAAPRVPTLGLHE